MFLAIAENVHDMCYRLELTPERRFGYVSPASAEVTGFAPEAFYRDPDLAFDHVHPEDRWVLNRIRAGAADREPARFRFERANCQAGWVWLEDRATRIIGPDGRPEALVGIVRDVTAQLDAERALEVALEHERAALERFQTFERIRDAFIASVSHELRTPITSILGFSWVLAKRGDHLEPEQVTHLASRISANATRLGGLLTDLMEVHEIEARVAEGAATCVDLADVVCDEARAQRWPRPGVSLCLQPATVDGSRPRLSRLVRALFDNVQRHAGPDARVWVTCDHDGPDVRLVVEDDGPGVPEALASTLFEPFMHGPAAASSPQPGLGIGLALVNGYAALHGGSARLDRSQHGGTRVEVRIPAAAAPAAAS